MFLRGFLLGFFLGDSRLCGRCIEEQHGRKKFLSILVLKVLDKVLYI